jgi:hypothetical protein
MNIMDNLDTSDVLLNRGLNGYYGGAGRHGYNGNFTYDGSVINSKLEGNRDIITLGHTGISQQISDNADRNRDISRTQQSDGHFTGIIGKIDDQTRFFTTEINLLAREQAANARAVAECCCETKLLLAENQAKTDAGLASILANQDCNQRVEQAMASATQNAKLDSILASNSHGYGGGRGN